jgi:hypothetical protein
MIDYKNCFFVSLNKLDLELKLKNIITENKLIKNEIIKNHNYQDVVNDVYLVSLACKLLVELDKELGLLKY